VRLGNGDSRFSGIIAGRVGLWQVFSPSRLSETLAAWSAADPFLLVAATGQYQFATDDFITDSLALLVNTKPTVRYNDLHFAGRYKLTPLQSFDASVYFGHNGLVGNRTASNTDVAMQEDSRVADLSIGDDYAWTNTTARLAYSTFAGNRTLIQVESKFSQYRLRHDYELIENLYLPSNLVDLSPLEGNAAVEAADRNDVNYSSLGVTVDHSRLKHQFGLGADVSYYATQLDLKSASPNDEVDIALGPRALVSVRSAAVQMDKGILLLSMFAEDRWRPSRNVTVTGGVRSTLDAVQKRVYAEPKLSLQARATLPIGEFGWRTSIGLYRQYLIQTDVSKLNAGSLLPSVRTWIPVDQSIRPPMSYHLAQSISLAPVHGVLLLGEAYSKFHTRGYAVKYTNLTSDDVVQSTDLRVADLLGSTSGRTAGLSLKAKVETNLVAGSVRYGYVRAHTEGTDLFSGERTMVRGVDPHEFDVDLTVRPNSSVIARAAWRTARGRGFGFTSAYYDYYGHDEALRSHGTFDFGDPDAHVLPTFHQLDLSVAVARRVGRLGVQMRADMLNVLDRENVAEWKLIYSNGRLTKRPRPLYPRMTTLSMRFSW
ncbi:MAG: hypothetical protein HKN13_06480, partial [Rhodothermales bacterium]|nr:hypothetical protein [Rhodothermales bacterium]